ncbi:unnamed protein product [Angiostrongylus costaricensis]|uniref:CN hydrolase domain-containing protein n=1 Tax=Angiostrongylus costaricensis TaxID=334426 RepID=A0A158PL75_ANGCS|nr:unnamed protein product [Angiostrongylus costaricensis]
MLKTAFQRTMSGTCHRGRSLIAVCQLTSDHDIERNVDICKDMVERASFRNCKMIFFPECFDFVGRSKEENITLASEEQGPVMELNRIEVSLIDNNGKTRALYNKLHLFDLEIPGKVRLMESEFSKKGTKVVLPVETPVGRLGLSICYDLRFAELALWNRQRGADILSYPSAFTLNTGLAHWEPLLRTRAIESQCYVVAAAQTGKHNEKRLSYGHSMVVDPWGAVIAQCSERVDMCFADVDLSYVDELRSMQPVFAHRRADLYTLHVNEFDAETPLKFGEFPISNDTIFYRSAHSFAFVNLKPVLNGHVLVSPKRVCYRLTDLSDAETADLFIVSKKVQKMLEKVSFGCKSVIHTLTKMRIAFNAYMP